MAVLPDRILKVPEKWNPYQRAHEGRVGVTHPDVRSIRKPFMTAVFGNLILLTLLFFAMFCYIFGSLYTETDKVHNLHVLYMDYDGGVIGDSVRQAYQKLQSNQFPTLVEEPPLGSSPDENYFNYEVCKTHFWATLYSAPGSSDRLSAALGGGSAAANYDPKDVFTYTYDGARYPTVIDGAIEANMVKLLDMARVAYGVANASGAVQSLDTSDNAAVQAFYSPWEPNAINIKRTDQGSRTIYNTLCIILILIQEFFYLAALNGMYAEFKVYEKIHPHRLILFRLGISIMYCFLGALCVTGAIWIFKHGWDVNGNEFVLTWMIVWLFAHSTFLVFDAISVWVPQMFVPMFLVTWIVMSVSSILLPFELMPGFYHWSYAIPAHALFTTELDIWSGGCNPTLAVNLPVLFAWEILGVILSCVGMHRRAHYAVVHKEQQEAQFQEKVADAMAFERKRDAERREERERSAAAGELEEAKEDETSEDARDRTEMEAELRREQSRAARSRSRRSSRVNFGPAFANPFGNPRLNED